MTQEFVTLPREVVEQAIDALYCTNSQEGSPTYNFELKAVKELRAALEQPHTTEQSYMGCVTSDMHELAEWLNTMYEDSKEQIAALEQHQQKASSSNDLPAETGDLSSSAKSRWKWVAVEPTNEMCQAGEIEMTTYGADASPSGIYKAMLKVAPQQPTTEQSSAVRQPQGEQDPVATLHCTDECYVYASVTDSGKQMRFEHPLPIYTYPPALRKPLTVEQIAAATGAKPGTPTWLVAVAFTRAVEASHNIK